MALVICWLTAEDRDKLWNHTLILSMGLPVSKIQEPGWLDIGTGLPRLSWKLAVEMSVVVFVVECLNEVVDKDFQCPQLNNLLII